MNNNQRTEQQQANETARLLESEDKKNLAADQRHTIELAQAARDSIQSRLPESNRDLRDLLAKQLDGVGVGGNEEAKLEPSGGSPAPVADTALGRGGVVVDWNQWLVLATICNAKNRQHHEVSDRSRRDYRQGRRRQ